MNTAIDCLRLYAKSDISHSVHENKPSLSPLRSLLRSMNKPYIKAEYIYIQPESGVAQSLRQWVNSTSVLQPFLLEPENNSYCKSCKS